LRSSFIAGACAQFCRYAVEEELLDHSPAAHVRRPRLDCESHATALDRNELGALLVAAGRRNMRRPVPVRWRVSSTAVRRLWPALARSAR
jgi:hypothetical protein